jgi:phosphatidylinositol kinase/protein kinase (PI-3  family)
MDPDDPIIYWREQFRKSDAPTMDQGPRNIAVMKIYTDICNNLVPEYILDRYMHKTMPNPDQLWEFKKEFAAQLGLASFMSHILKYGDRSLWKIGFFKHSGRVVNAEFYATYNEQMLCENTEVQFRLTRNLVTLMTPFLVEGVFQATITASNSCLLGNQEILKNYFSLMVRDDLIGWNGTKVQVLSDEYQRNLEKQFKEKVNINVQAIIKRIVQLMPPSSGDANAGAPVNSKIMQLIKSVTSKQRVSQQSVTWHPWF